MPQRSLVQATLIAPQTVSGLVKQLPHLRSWRERGAIVTADNHQRLLVQVQFLEQVKHLAQVAVQPGHLSGVGFLSRFPGPVGIDPQVIDFVPAMRQRDGIEQEERTVAVGADPAEYVLLNQVLGIHLANRLAIVTLEHELLIIAIQVPRKIGMGLALAVVAKKMIEALFERVAGRIKVPHTPLAHAGRGVARLLQNLGHRDGLGGQCASCPSGGTSKLPRMGQCPQCWPVISDERLGAHTLVPQ